MRRRRDGGRGHCRFAKGSENYRAGTVIRSAEPADKLPAVAPGNPGRTGETPLNIDTLFYGLIAASGSDRHQSRASARSGHNE